MLSIEARVITHRATAVFEELMLRSGALKELLIPSPAQPDHEGEGGDAEMRGRMDQVNKLAAQVIGPVGVRQYVLAGRLRELSDEKRGSEPITVGEVQAGSTGLLAVKAIVVQYAGADKVADHSWVQLVLAGEDGELGPEITSWHSPSQSHLGEPGGQEVPLNYSTQLGNFQRPLLAVAGIALGHLQPGGWRDHNL